MSFVFLARLYFKSLIYIVVETIFKNFCGKNVFMTFYSFKYFLFILGLPQGQEKLKIM